MHALSLHTCRSRLRGAAAIVVACATTACQTYEPRPLDLDDYSRSFEARSTAFEPVEAFVERLNDGTEVIDVIFDPSDGLSPAEGEVLALFYNADLRMARMNAGVALAEKDTAGLWKDPVFGFDAAEILSPSGRPFEWGIGVSFTIPISGRLDVEKDRAGAIYETSLREIIDAEWRTRADVRDRWSAWSGAIERMTLVQQTTQALEALDRRVDRLHQLDALNRVERRLFAVELATQEAALAQAELEELHARTALLETLGLPPEAAALFMPAVSMPDVPIPDDVTARLIDANTELAVEFAGYHVAEETLRLEVQKQYPDIVFGPGYGTEFNDHRVMFGISLPLPILNANRAGIARARAEREVARTRAETTFARIDRRLGASLESLDVARAQRRVFEDRIVPLLTRQREDLDRIAELGEIDMFVTLETLTRELDARMRLVALRLAEQHAASTATYLLGPAHPTPPAPVILTPSTEPRPHSDDGDS